MKASLLFLACLQATAWAQTDTRDCQNLTIPITITSRNAVFGNLPVPQNNFDATAFALAATRTGANGTDLALTGYNTITGSYNISAKLCMPPAGYASASHLQILIHGISFDKTYWDLSYNGYNYSYTNAALGAGYATLAIDRLGIGLSSHGEPRDEIQSFLQVEALAQVTRIARQGQLPNNQGRTFSSVVHVGHSFGSAQVYSLADKYPELTNGIVLTGFSMNASFVSLFNAGNDLQIANLNQPLRFGSRTAAITVQNIINQYSLIDYLAPIDVDTVAAEALNYPNGYLVNSNAGALNYLHFHNYNFDPSILYFAEKTKQPVTVGEGLTLGSIVAVNAYTGPVLVVTGQYDLPYCGGDCLATGGAALSIPDVSVRPTFPKASAFEAYIQPNTGHGLAFHYNSTGGYQVIQTWLANHNLGATKS